MTFAKILISRWKTQTKRLYSNNNSNNYNIGSTSNTNNYNNTCCHA